MEKLEGEFEELSLRKTPIQIVPDELLTHIWSYVDFDTSGAPFMLAGVCQHWRSLALATPPLWSKLLLVMENEQPKPGLKTHLERSGEALLTVRFVRCSPEVFDVVSQHTSRWSSLFATDQTFLRVTSLLLQMTKQPSYDPRYNQVRDVTLDFGYVSRQTDEVADYRVWPNLTRFNITCPSLMIYLPLLPPSLKHITIKCRLLHLSHLCELFTSCPNLEEFTISAMSLRQDVDRLPPLPKLQELTIHTSSLLDRLLLCASNLQRLVIKPQLLAEQIIFPNVKVTTSPTNFISLRIHIENPIPAAFRDHLKTLLQSSLAMERLTVVGSRVRLTYPDIKYLFTSIVSPVLKFLEFKYVMFDLEVFEDVARRMSDSIKSAEGGGVAPRRISLVGCEGVSEEDVIRLRPALKHVEVDWFPATRP